MIPLKPRRSYHCYQEGHQKLNESGWKMSSPISGDVHHGSIPWVDYDRPFLWCIISLSKFLNTHSTRVPRFSISCFRVESANVQHSRGSCVDFDRSKAMDSAESFLLLQPRINRLMEATESSTTECSGAAAHITLQPSCRRASSKFTNGSQTSQSYDSFRIN